MTGGTSEAGKINRNLALAAQETRIVGVGSPSAIENPINRNFQVRYIGYLVANLGAVS
jgi:isopentenyl diphosphate isomerase/L-lactate dehydrogenase-like FMN-dependent dehydrogenase